MRNRFETAPTVRACVTAGTTCATPSRDLARDLLVAEVRRNGLDSGAAIPGKIAFIMADEFTRNMAVKLDAREAEDAAAANAAHHAAIAAEEAADKAERAHTHH